MALGLLRGLSTEDAIIVPCIVLNNTRRVNLIENLKG